MGRGQMHVRNVYVWTCPATNCVGNERGCASPDCPPCATQERITHGAFVKRYGRCPVQCAQRSRGADWRGPKARGR